MAGRQLIEAIENLAPGELTIGAVALRNQERLNDTQKSLIRGIYWRGRTRN
jgi:hypothetical protein